MLSVATRSTGSSLCSRCGRGRWRELTIAPRFDCRRARLGKTDEVPGSASGERVVNPRVLVRDRGCPAAMGTTAGWDDPSSKACRALPCETYRAPFRPGPAAYFGISDDSLGLVIDGQTFQQFGASPPRSRGSRFDGDHISYKSVSDTVRMSNSAMGAMARSLVRRVPHSNSFSFFQLFEFFN